MNLVDRCKQYPLVLWALLLYLCSLNFNLKYDVPLLLFTLATFFTLSNTDRGHTSTEIMLRHWHVVAFVAITVLLTLLSNNPHKSFLSQAQFIPAILMYVAIVTAVERINDLRFIYNGLVVFALLVAVVLLYLLLTSDWLDMDMTTVVKKSKSPLFIVPNDALMLTILSPVVLGVLVTEKSRLIQLGAFMFLLLAGFITVYIQSRQATAVFAIGMFAFFFLWRPLWGFVVGLLAVVMVFVVDAMLGSGLVNKIFLFPRVYIWKSAWHMFLDSPFLGKGPGLFKDYYYEFLEVAGYTASVVEDRRLMNWAHSLYLEQLSERGVVGFLALGLLLGRPVLGFLKQLCARVNEVGIRAYHMQLVDARQMGLLVAFLALLLGGIAELSLLRLWTVTLIFLLLALSHLEDFHLKNNSFHNKKK